MQTIATEPAPRGLYRITRQRLPEGDSERQLQLRDIGSYLPGLLDRDTARVTAAMNTLEATGEVDLGAVLVERIEPKSCAAAKS